MCCYRRGAYNFRDFEPHLTEIVVAGHEELAFEVDQPEVLLSARKAFNFHFDGCRDVSVDRERLILPPSEEL